MSHIWMSHVTHMNESCHIWIRHVTNMNESWHTYEPVMSHIWMSHVTHMNWLCHICAWVMSHIWISHVTHTNESCHTYERVMSHIWTSHVTHMNESCHTYERVMSHIWISDVTHICEWVMSHVWISHSTHMNELCHTYEWVMSHIGIRTPPCVQQQHQYRVASNSRIDKIIGLFCKRDLKKRLYSAKLTYNFIDPTDRSHPIGFPTCAHDWKNRDVTWLIHMWQGSFTWDMTQFSQIWLKCWRNLVRRVSNVDLI